MTSLSISVSLSALIHRQMMLKSLNRRGLSLNLDYHQSLASLFPWPTYSNHLIDVRTIMGRSSFFHFKNFFLLTQNFPSQPFNSRFNLRLVALEFHGFFKLLKTNRRRRGFFYYCAFYEATVY